MKTIPTELKIDPQFAALIPPLAPEEREQLERNILADGCRDPLTVWAVPDEFSEPEYIEAAEKGGKVYCKYCRGDVTVSFGDGIIVCDKCEYGLSPNRYAAILIDGHNRYEICTRHGIPFNTIEKDFADRDEAMDWMDANQLGRRNLSPDAFTLLLGRRYNRAKAAHGGDRKSSRQSDDLKTAQKLAAQHGVGSRTVERAGQFAEAVDKLQLGAEVVSGRVDSTRKSVIQAASALPENPTKEQVEEAKKHVHVSKNSGNNEWYTPAEYIEAATALMGCIDLDPASSPKANETVGAAKFYTAEDDGREKDWAGNVWMNPPYAQPLIADFSNKVAEAYERGEVSSACVLVNNATETSWFQRMLKSAAGVCFPRARVRFLDPNGKPGAPLQGQAVIYFGKEAKTFCQLFERFGQCLTAN